MKVVWRSNSGVEYYLFTESTPKSSSATSPASPSLPTAPRPSGSTGSGRRTARLYTEALLEVLERTRDLVRCLVRGKRVVFISRSAPDKIRGARPDGFWKSITNKLRLTSRHPADVEVDFDFWNEALRVFTSATMRTSGCPAQTGAGDSAEILVVERPFLASAAGSPPLPAASAPPSPPCAQSPRAQLPAASVFASVAMRGLPFAATTPGPETAALLQPPAVPVLLCGLPPLVPVPFLRASPPGPSACMMTYEPCVPVYH
eukprot:m51a1_g274 hypothetical protein (260) ;mRNA; r:264159-265007